MDQAWVQGPNSDDILAISGGQAAIDT